MASSTQSPHRRSSILTISNVRKASPTNKNITPPSLPAVKAVSKNHLFSPVSENPAPLCKLVSTAAAPKVPVKPYTKQWWKSKVKPKNERYLKAKAKVKAEAQIDPDLKYPGMPSMDDGSELDGAPEEFAALHYMNEDLELDIPQLSENELNRMFRLQSPDYDECLINEYWTCMGMLSEDHSTQSILETQLISAPSQVLVVDKEWERQYQEEVLRWEVSKNLIDNGLRPLSRSVFLTNKKVES